MRSVFVHLCGTYESEFSAWLDRHYKREPEQWLLERDEDPCLYIDFYRDGPVEDENRFTRFADRGGPPPVTVTADISGRHEGWEETKAFVVTILKSFDGTAEDDGGVRLWSGPEVEADLMIDGRKFGLVGANSGGYPVAGYPVVAVDRIQEALPAAECHSITP